MPAALRAHSVGREMPTFLVESYVPPDADPMHAAIAIDESASAGHRWSLLLPEEEICFHLFEGRSVETVREVAARIGVRCDRISEAVVVQLVSVKCEGGSP
jgi:hypothetical protein